MAVLHRIFRKQAGAMSLILNTFSLWRTTCHSIYTVGVRQGRNNHSGGRIMAATTEQNNSGDRDVEKAFAFRTHKRKKD